MQMSTIRITQMSFYKKKVMLNPFKYKSLYFTELSARSRLTCTEQNNNCTFTVDKIRIRLLNLPPAVVGALHEIKFVISFTKLTVIQQQVGLIHGSRTFSELDTVIASRRDGVERFLRLSRIQRCQLWEVSVTFEDKIEEYESQNFEKRVFTRK